MSEKKNAILKIVSGLGRGTVFNLKEERYLCGRDISNDIVLDDDLVSPTHCEFLKGENTYIVQDLGSTTGTKVNQLKIDKHELKNYDIVQLGKVDLLYYNPETSKENGSPSLRTGISLEQLETDISSFRGMKNFSPFAENGRNKKKLIHIASTTIIVFLALIALGLIIWLFLISLF